MKVVIILIIILCPTFLYGVEKNPVVIELVSEVEKLSYEIDQNSRRIGDNFKVLEKRVASYSMTLSELSGMKANVDSKYKTILEVGADIKRLNIALSSFGEKQAVLDTKITQIRHELTSTNHRILNSQTIVTWVTLIVSVLIILIGLFFSKVFLNLHSSVQVFRSHLPEAKRKKIDGVVEV